MVNPKIYTKDSVIESMPESYEMKPSKITFVRYPYAKTFLFSLLFFGAVYYALNIFARAYAPYTIIVFVLFQVSYYYSLSVRYDKEKYIFRENKIIRKSGGIFSDSQTELLIKNITHVGMRLSYVEYKLFETGNISIESAGSGGTEVQLRSIDNIEKIYEYIAELMKHNGFKLAKDSIIQQERPSTIGVFLETFKSFISTSMLIAYIGMTTYSSLPVLNLAGINELIALSAAGLVMLAIFLNTFFRFMNLKRRVYNVYTDTITYAEGFLTKNEAFIPIENLTDTTITQNLIDKIFGLYDVRISCQGTGQEILFKNMPNGKELEKNIDRLIEERHLFEAQSYVSGIKQETDIQLPVHAASRAPAPQGDTIFTAEYRMDGKRTLMPLLAALPLFLIVLVATPNYVLLGMVPLLIIWIAVFAVTMVKLNATRYLVKAKSMEEQYTFLSTKNKEFSNEKITGIIFKESFIDKWFNTCSIHFWSIGSSEKVIFSNIYKTDELRKSIAAKSGMWSREVLYNINSDFSVIDMLKANLLANILGGLFMASIIAASILYSPWLAVIPAVAIILYVAGIFYNKIYYLRSKMTFFKDHIYFEKGVFFKDFYYVLYDNIKNISTVKYPFSGSGSVTFDVAGEQVTQSGQTQVVLSNAFAINYAEDIENKDDLIDMIFYKRPGAEKIQNIENNIHEYSSKPVLVAKPDVMNSLVPLVLGSIIAFPLIALLPITIPLTIWSVRVTSYIIEPYRVLKKSGILYKRQKSIVFSKIDHINFEEGFLNKMFRNGTVTINTVGSSKSEMTVANTPNFREFYDTLKQHY